MIRQATLIILPVAILASIAIGRDPVGAVHGTSQGLFEDGVQPLGAGQ